MTQSLFIPELNSIEAPSALQEPVGCFSSGDSDCYPNVNALIVIDTLGVVVDVNSLMCEMFGAHRDALIGFPFKQFFTDPKLAEDAIRTVLAEERIVDYRLSFLSTSGRISVISFDAMTHRGADKKLKGVLATARDISDQSCLEDDLRQAQHYTRGLIEASFDALLTIDPELRIIDVNEQTARMTGFSREELIGSFFTDYFGESGLAGDGVAKTLAEGFLNDYVLELKSKTGFEKLVSFNASVYTDTEGRIRGIFAAGRDITEQSRLEDELRQAQNYTRGLIEASIDPIFTVDADLTITDVNDQMVRLTEIPKGDLVGSRFTLLFTEPERAAAGVRETLRESSVTNYELTLRTPSGREVPVSFNASIFKDTAGKVKGIFAVARDNSEQKQIEQAMRELQVYTRGLIESNIDAMMTTDTLGIITDVNKQMCSVTGCTQEQLVGTPFKNYFTDPKRAEDAIRLVLSEDRVINYELTLQAQKGRELLVSYNATTFMGGDGKLRGVFASARDITVQKRLEEQLQRKNEELEEQNRRVQEATRLKSEFLANMSHELRTPLNGIIGFSELMHDGKVGAVSDDHKEYLGDILTSSRHLQQLINDVLDLAKVESGKMEFRPEPVNLTQLVGEVRDILRTLTAEKRIKLEAVVDPALNDIVADPAKLKQVLYNYLSNAIKFTPEEGRVSIRALLEGKESFRLEVEDTGIGISAEDFPRLFIEFQQLDASTAKKYQGTGLGLALTRNIVEAQGGQVGVTSSPGRGSTFHAILPRKSTAGEGPGLDHSPARAQRVPHGR